MLADDGRGCIIVWITGVTLQVCDGNHDIASIRIAVKSVAETVRVVNFPVASANAQASKCLHCNGTCIEMSTTETYQEHVTYPSTFAKA